MNRAWELDALRGLMLVLMTLTHLPTQLSDPFGQPFGFVSAAEGFVLLSAYMAGKVYTARERKHGAAVMKEAFFQRAWKIYLCQAALLMFLMSVVAVIGWITDQEAIKNLISFYLQRPLTALFSGLLLVYSPPLLDILPMYILFMLISPLLLLHGLHRGWGRILGISAALWLAAQFDFGREVYDVFNAIAPIPVPYREIGAFEILAWQFVWVMGLWMGSSAAETPDAPPLRFPRWMVHTAIVIGVVGIVWRHVVGQTPFPGMPALEPLFDKWHLGPMRLINFFALLVLVMHFGPWLKTHVPRSATLEMMGQQSLPVFCAHLVFALMALALAGEVNAGRSVAVDAAILGITFAALIAVAWFFRQLDRQSAKVKESIRSRRPSAPIRPARSRPRWPRRVRQSSEFPGARRQRSSTPHNPAR